MSRKASRRELILDTALKLVEHEGVGALTQPRLAKATGLRGSHITYYFPKKADLLAAVLAASHGREQVRSGEDVRALFDSPERMRVFLAAVLAANGDATASKTLCTHVEGFEGALAEHYAMKSTDSAVRSFVDELRGAGIRRLFERNDQRVSVDAIASRHGLASGPAMNGVKRFDDAAHYELDIGRVVPAHELVRNIAAAALSTRAPSTGRLLVSGSGPGAELISFANALPAFEIDAVDPSAEMRASAKASVAKAVLSSRVRVHARMPKGSYEAAVSLLVVHLLDSSARATYLNSLAECMVPGGLLLIAEIIRRPEHGDVWRAWSRACGSSETRLAQLGERLATFPLVSDAESRAGLEAAGFRDGVLLVDALGVTLRCWTRASRKTTRGARTKPALDA